MGKPATQPSNTPTGGAGSRYRLSARQGVQVLFVAALGLGLTGSLARRGLPPGDVLLGAFVTLLASGHVYVLLWRENRARRLLAATAETARRAEAACERSAREKREFMANVGHELSAPLAAIVGFAEVLRASDGSAPAERHEIIETILRSGRRLLNITSDMLDLSRLEAGRLTVQRGDCSPAAIMGEVETLMRPLAAQRSLRFRIEQPGPIPVCIHTDPARLRQIMVNLATHALRAPERGLASVTVSLDADQSRLLMESPAGRAAGAVLRLLDGAGASGRFDSARLGLVIAQRLATLLGGGLELVGSASGRRPVIRASIDTGPLEGVEMAPPPRQPDTSDAPPATLAGAALPAPQLDARIMLVDEEGDDQRLIGFHLRHAGAEVEIEDGAAEAASRAVVAMQAGRPFDLIVVDAQEEQLAEVRRLRQQGYQAPVVAIGAAGEACARDVCLQAGCNEFVESPVSPARLIELCARSLARREPRDTESRGAEAA